MNAWQTKTCLHLQEANLKAVLINKIYITFVCSSSSKYLYIVKYRHVHVYVSLPFIWSTCETSNSYDLLFFCRIVGLYHWNIGICWSTRWLKTKQMSGKFFNFVCLNFWIGCGGIFDLRSSTVLSGKLLKILLILWRNSCWQCAYFLNTSESHIKLKHCVWRLSLSFYYQN